jgi:hypothetical protein
MRKDGITYLCDCCGTERGVKERKHNEIIEGNFCLGCWNAYKKDIGKVFICSDCGSNKAKKRIISTGVGKNNYMSDILCESCFIDMFYEYSN